MDRDPSRSGGLAGAGRQYDLGAPEVRADPFPLFDELRAHDPVLDTGTGYWYVSTYEAGSRLLHDPRFGAGRGVPDSLGVTSGPLYDAMSTWMMALDGAAHERVRRLISRSFTPRAVESLRQPLQRLTDGLLDGIAERRRADVVEDLAFPVPAEAVRLLFGVGTEEWASRVVPIIRPHDAIASGTVDMMTQLMEYLAEVVARRRVEPGDDMFSAMVRPDPNGDVLDDGQLLANALLLVTAGFETSMSLITLAILALLRHPDQCALLRAEPSLIQGAVEEVLRFEPAALSTTRCALEDVEIGGRTIPAGAHVLVPMPAVNRDPERYLEPGRFDITRAQVRPLTFGGGPHLCIGAPLARLEAEVVVGSFFQRFAQAALAPDPLEWQDANPTVRRPVTLYVEV